MPGLFDSMRHKADQAALEADKLMRIRREQAAIDQLRRDIRVQMDALGQAAFTAYRAGEIAHPHLVSICRQIDALTEQIAQHEAQIEQIRAERLAPPPPVLPPTGPTVRCPNCRQPVPAQAAFCPHCGFQVPKAPPAGVVCASCGSAIPAGAQFCPTCGARQALPPPPPPSPPPQTIRCPSCGAELPTIAVFCPDCGTRLSGTPAPAMPSAPRPHEPTPTVWLPSEPEETAVPIATSSLLTEPDPTPAASLPSTEATTLPATKRCPACDAELPLTAVFCGECGTRQEVAG